MMEYMSIPACPENNNIWHVVTLPIITVLVLQSQTNLHSRGKSWQQNGLIQGLN